MSNSYCTAEVQDSWCNALNSLDENGLEYQPAAEFKCQTTQQLYQQEKDTFLHLPICTFPLRQSMSSIQQHINAQMIYRPAGAVPQQEDLLAAGAVWVCCRWYRRVCGVCWAVHLWNEQRCICNQGSPTKPNLDPVIKQPGLTPAPSKPRLLRRSLAMIILWFTEREKTINLNSMFTHSRISAEII